MQRWIGLIFIILVFTISSVQAQVTCAAQLTQTLQTLGAACGNTLRGQACFGSSTQLSPQGGVVTAFGTSGDKVGLENVQSLQAAQGSFLTQIPANLPENEGGVTLLAWGDVLLKNRGGSPATVLVTARGNMNVRSQAGVDSLIVTTLTAGETVFGDGINTDGTWLRVATPAGLGWVFREIVDVAGNVGELSVVQDLADPARVPFGNLQSMQITFNDTVGCTDVPASGILLQTAPVTTPAELLINNIQVTMPQATVYLGALTGGTTPANALVFIVLEGGITLTAQGATFYIPAGGQGIIPLTEAGLPAGVPNVQGVERDFVWFAPFLATLPRQITAAAPLTTEALLAALQPTSGEWLLTYLQPGVFYNCEIGSFEFREIPAAPVPITLTQEGDQWILGVTGSATLGRVPLNTTDQQTYSGSVSGAKNATWTFTLRAATPTRMTGEVHYNDACPYQGAIVLQKQ